MDSTRDHREPRRSSAVCAPLFISPWTTDTCKDPLSIESDRLTRGLLNGIERCGAVLDEHGLEARPDSDDELSDPLRREDE